MRSPANHVQEHRNAPEPHHAGTKASVLPLMVCHRGTRLRPLRNTITRYARERFKDYLLERYANNVVDMSNKVFFFSCTGSDLVLCLSYFSRELWILQERFYGQLLCTLNDSLAVQSLCRRFGTSCIHTVGPEFNEFIGTEHFMR
ncbi:uncharacterized protein TNCV_2385641 [Trichonephila clavipes]|nr:uncharacterized protein TNCV_2385641 [Trichonephila clavipes]